jgi:hypothetical protein
LRRTFKDAPNGRVEFHFMARFKFGRSVWRTSLALVLVAVCAVAVLKRLEHLDERPADSPGAVQVEASAVVALRERLLAVNERVAASASPYAAASSPWEFFEWIGVVRACGASGHVSFKPLLRVIAERAPDSESAALSLEAMDSLYRVGESIEYFRIRSTDLSKGHWVARNAMLICGREPNAERAVTFLELSQHARREEGPYFGEKLAEAASSAQQVVEHDLRVAQLDKLEQKVGLLARLSIGGGLGPLCPPRRLESEAIEHRADPQVAWGRTWLEQLAAEFPVETAQALLSTTFDGLLESRSDLTAAQRTRLLNETRDYVSGVLPADALAIYRRDRAPDVEDNEDEEER